MSPVELKQYQNKKIENINDDATNIQEKVLEGLTDSNLGATAKNDLGKSRSFKPLHRKVVTREDLTSTKRYNKFRDEFKDIFEQVYEDQQQNNKNM